MRFSLKQIDLFAHLENTVYCNVVTKVSNNLLYLKLFNPYFESYEIKKHTIYLSNIKK